MVAERRFLYRGVSGEPHEHPYLPEDSLDLVRAVEEMRQTLDNIACDLYEDAGGHAAECLARVGADWG